MAESNGVAMNSIEKQNQINQRYADQKDESSWVITVLFWLLCPIIELTGFIILAYLRFNEWKSMKQWRKRMKAYADNTPEAYLQRCWDAEFMEVKR